MLVMFYENTPQKKTQPKHTQWFTDFRIRQVFALLGL